MVFCIDLTDFNTIISILLLLGIITLSWLRMTFRMAIKNPIVLIILIIALANGFLRIKMTC